MLSRRGFVSWLSGVGAALGIGVRVRPVQGTEPASTQASPLDTAAITRLAEAVLPGELGDAGMARVARGFTQWVASYRAGAELNHPYGSATIRHTGASPAVRWRGQLQALDRQARERHRRGFGAITRDQRRDLVAAVINEQPNVRLGDPVAADHVAVALLSWYFAQPEATDLCYQSRIERNQCRPLVNTSRQPLPLAGPARGTRG